MNTKLILTAVILTFSLVAFAADEPDLSKLPPVSDQKVVAYEKDIKPILEKSCFSCHGAEKQKGKLRLDSLAAAVKGGEDKVIEPGKSEKSLLVLSIAHVGDEDMWMPPVKGKIKPLTKEQVGLIRAWIDQGAK